MYLTTLALASTAALMANAIPHQGHGHAHLHAHQHAAEKRQDDGDTFNVHVLNNCGDDKTFGVYQISSSFDMIQVTDPVEIAAGMAHTIAVPFQETGLRLSATADQGCAAQWDPQALFEMGYSEYAGQTGTAYDLSVMTGSDPSIGIQVKPMGGPTCPEKTCLPWDCPPGQGWTNPDQVDAGSPGDTVCYQGKTNFRVIWCPSS